MSFFQTFWEMLKVDIMGTLQHFHQHQVFEKNLNVTYVALIPKRMVQLNLEILANKSHKWCL